MWTWWDLRCVLWWIERCVVNDGLGVLLPALCVMVQVGLMNDLPQLQCEPAHFDDRPCAFWEPSKSFDFAPPRHGCFGLGQRQQRKGTKVRVIRTASLGTQRVEQPSSQVSQFSPESCRIQYYARTSTPIACLLVDCAHTSLRRHHPLTAATEKLTHLTLL